MSNSSKKSFFPLIVISALAVLPLALANVTIDADSPALVAQIRRILTDTDSAYRINRIPGSPAYELITAYFFGLFSKLHLPFEVERIFQTLSWCAFLVVLYLAHKDLKKLLKPNTAILAAACLAFHPIIIWHSWSFIEDMTGLMFAYLSFNKLRESPRETLAPAVLIAMAINCKMTMMGVFAGGFAYLFLAKEYAALLRFTLNAGAASFVLYLPAIASHNMDLIRSVTMKEKDALNLREHFSVAWALFRETLMIYMAVTFWMIAARVKKTKISFEDPLIGLFLILCYISFFQFRYVFVAVPAALAWIGYAWMKRRPEMTKNIGEWLPWVVIAASGIMFTIFAPYSKSFMLVGTPATIILVARKFKSTAFWSTVFAITFIPLFYYFIWNPETHKFTVYDHGYYKSLTQGIINEFNDFEFYRANKILEIP